MVLENDLPRIAYYDLDNGDLLFAAKSAGGSWSRIPVHADANDTGKFASLAKAPNGTLGIAYYDATAGDLLYAEGDAQGFGTPAVLDATGDVGQWPTLVFDLDSPRIAYQDYGNQDLKLAKKDGAGAWSIETVDAGDWVGADSAVAVDAAGKITIAYFDGLNNDVLAAVWNGTGWDKHTISSAGANGYFNNVVLAGDGQPVFGWYTYTGTRFDAQKGLALAP